MMNNVLTHFFDFFLPRFCPGCDKKLEAKEEPICSECLESILITDYERLQVEFNKNFRSAQVIEDFYSKFVFETDKTLQNIIHALKYKQKFKLGYFLGKILAQGIQAKGWQIDFIVPVPIHHLKKVERGFNQSEYIAKGLSSVLNIPYATKLIKRVKHTESQTKLNMNQRALNVANAFKAKNSGKIAGKNFLLVDDVCTTGATLQECGIVLYRAGAKKIYASSVAITE
jgi:ComF family protein